MFEYIKTFLFYNFLQLRNYFLICLGVGYAGTESFKNLYEISFYRNNNKFKILIPKNLKHNKIITSVVGIKTDIEENINTVNDITEKLQPYFGPNNDFFQVKLTPKMLEYDSLLFTFLDESKIQFHGDAVISF